MSHPNHYRSRLRKQHASNQARIVEVETPHGSFKTPCFMPVGTRAFVNLMTAPQLLDAGSQIILGGNTYHMLVDPGLETIEAAGGMHQMMAWQHPMLTDSGGYQVFSLSKNSKICRIDEDGAHFKHPDSGKLIHLNAESSLHAQKVIGADIIMAFDQCTPDDGDPNTTKAAFDRTHRWLERSKTYHEQHPHSVYGFKQALFGIVQGGINEALRHQSLEQVIAAEVDGIALGGEVIGYDMAKTVEVIRWLAADLPQDKVRYTMGVGLSPQDLIDVVAEGIDIFDCVAPSRNARHGALYCGEIVESDNWINFKGCGEKNSDRLSIKKSIYRHDEQAIMPTCTCYTCRHHSRAYLHFLFKSKSPLYQNLACIHNVTVMHEVCERMQRCITTSAAPTSGINDAAE